jgi:Cellulase (glycosyl hydrolase family 5)
MGITKSKNLFSSIVVVACLFCNVAWAAAWTASVGENGLPTLSKGGAAAVTSEFVFWGKDWQWAGLSAHFKVVAPFEYTITGESGLLNLHLTSRVQKPSSQRLTWTFDWDGRSSLNDVVGGGFAFQFDLEKFRSELGDPELLPDNHGWSWGRPGGTRVQLRFDPPLAEIKFERGNKGEVRAYFYSGEVPQGQRHYNAILELSNDIAIEATTTERFGLEDSAKWPREFLDFSSSPVDLSFLNDAEKPAGKHGFLKAVQDRLEFEDGTPVRFWGTNVTASSLFLTSTFNVKRQARRLSELGFNLVRIHHHDSAWVAPNIFGQNIADTKTLSAAMLEKLDWWIKCLKDEGIYVWLDLHVGRELTINDGIENFAEISRGRPSAEFKGYNYINPTIQQAMQNFNNAYVDHLNKFTGLRYKEDPGIVVMLLTNENDVTHHFGNSLLPINNVPDSKEGALYMQEAAAFATKHGLPQGEVWHAWEQGPPQLFLNDLQHRFDVAMTEQLRQLGVKARIATTSFWGEEPLSSLPALSAGDLIDVHSYGNIGDLQKNPIYAANIVDWIAPAQIIDRPLSVTEWNMGSFPIPDRHTLPLYIASAASLQGWDALMQFAYSGEPLNGIGSPSPWQSFNDAALLATLPAAALLYRRHDVKESNTVYVFAPTREQLFNQFISPANSVALRSAAEKGKLVLALPQTRELPWLQKSRVPAGAKMITDPKQSLIDAGASEAASDTGELRRNWEQGVYTINTPKSQAAMGWIGGRRISLADVEISFNTRNATIAVQSLDDKNIRTSRSLMISLCAPSVPSAGNRLPFHSEPVSGELIVHAPEGLQLYSTNKTADLKNAPAPQQEAIPAPFKDGAYHILLDGQRSGHWLYLR